MPRRDRTGAHADLPAQTRASARSVLILSAWEPEIAPLRRRLARAAAGAPARAVLCRTVGVGAIDAAVNAARAIAETRPGCVIFVGTAGSYPGRGRDLPIAAAVVPAAFALVATAVLRKEAYAPAPMIVRAPAAAALLEDLRLPAHGARPADAVACPLGITRTAALGRRIAAATSTQVENLEAFSVARAAALAGVPFAAVLGIANRVGPRAHAEWLRHHPAASRAACHAVWSWLVARRFRVE